MAGSSSKKYPPDERTVYLALKHVFNGSDADMRRKKNIQARITKELGQDEIRALVQEHTLDSVASVAKDLLARQIFASTLKAKVFFPEVFDLSPGQSAEREASEAEASRSDETAIRAVAEGMSSCALTTQVLPKPSLEPRSDGQDNTLTINTGVDVPSLYPVFLPFPPQHQLLTRVQMLLEHCCYRFAERRLPDVLKAKNWESAEQVELNVWTSILKQNPELLGQNKMTRLSKPFPALCDSVAQIRHTAVHRINVSANTVNQFMDEAVQFIDLLEETAVENDLMRIRRAVKLAIDELSRNKDLLRLELAEKLSSIDRVKQELARREQNAIRDTFKVDADYRNLSGSQIIASLSPDTKGKMRAMDDDAQAIGSNDDASVNPDDSEASGFNDTPFDD